MYFPLSLNCSMIGLQKASISLENEPATYETYLVNLKVAGKHRVEPF